jgi:hypothetical protein
MDRELLELASKACGLEEAEFNQWTPLEDDGDALRLAVKLKIPMQFPDWADLTRTWASKDCLDAFDEPHGTDPLAATRRAITRAAAEIGKAMP